MAKHAESAAVTETVARAESEQSREAPEARETAPERASRFGAHRFEVAERSAELMGRGREHYVEMKSDRETLARFEQHCASGALERQCANPQAARDAKAALETLQPHLQGAKEHIAAKSEIYRSLGLDPDKALRGEKLSWREQWRFRRAEKRSQAYEKARDNRNVLFEEFSEGAEGLSRKEYKRLKKDLLKADDRLDRAGERFTGRKARSAGEYKMKAYTPEQQADDLQKRLAEEYPLEDREGPWAQRKQARRRETMERAVGGVLRLENRGQELDRASEHAKTEGNVKELIWAHESRQGNGQELSRARNRAGNSYERAQRAGKVYEMIHRLRERGADAAKAGMHAAKETWAGKADSVETVAEERSGKIAAEADRTVAGADDISARLGELDRRVGVLETGQTNLQSEIARIAKEHSLNPKDTQTLAAMAAEIIKGRQEAAVAERERGATVPGSESRPGAKEQPEATAGANTVEQADAETRKDFMISMNKYKENIYDRLFSQLGELSLEQLRKVVVAAEADAKLRAAKAGEEIRMGERLEFQRTTNQEWVRKRYGINQFIESSLAEQRARNQQATSVPAAR